MMKSSNKVTYPLNAQTHIYNVQPWIRHKIGKNQLFGSR